MVPFQFVARDGEPQVEDGAAFYDGSETFPVPAVVDGQAEIQQVAAVIAAPRPVPPPTPAPCIPTPNHPTMPLHLQYQPQRLLVLKVQRFRNPLLGDAGKLLVHSKIQK